MEVAGLKDRVVVLESNLVEKQNEILFLEEEVRSLRIKLTKRDAELAKQERELNKLRVTFLLTSVIDFLPFYSFLTTGYRKSKMVIAQP